MLPETIFFGALQLNISASQPVNWKSCEKAFFSPSLPPRKTVDVRVSFVDELPAPEGNCVYQSRDMTVYHNQGETRYYHPCQFSNEKAYTSSHYNGSSVTVCQSDSRLWADKNFFFLTAVHIERLLLDVRALVLHSCYTEYQNEAVLFTAPSGTGKTTQAQLWKRVYGSSIVNGDKCILQQDGDGFYACGFFLHGSALECENRTLPVRAIVILRQSDRDYIEELNPAQKVGLLYSEVTVNSWDGKSISDTFDVLEALITNTKVIMLHCTMQDSAAHVLHKYLYGG